MRNKPPSEITQDISQSEIDDDAFHVEINTEFLEVFVNSFPKIDDIPWPNFTWPHYSNLVSPSREKEPIVLSEDLTTSLENLRRRHDTGLNLLTHSIDDFKEDDSDKE